MKYVLIIALAMQTAIVLAQDALQDNKENTRYAYYVKGLTESTFYICQKNKDATFTINEKRSLPLSLGHRIHTTENGKILEITEPKFRRQVPIFETIDGKEIQTGSFPMPEEYMLIEKKDIAIDSLKKHGLTWLAWITSKF